MTVRLYGRSGGNGSHAVVTRGFQLALEEAGLLEGFFPLDLPEDELVQHPGALARDGVFTGALNLIRQLSINARHERRWAVVAPNSTYVPPVIVNELHRANVTCLAPSIWASGVLHSYNLRTIVVRHGVSGFDTAAREMAREEYEKGLFRVMHLSTSAGQRKSTFELIQAWCEAQGAGYIPSTAQLVCVLDHDARTALRERLLDAELATPTTVDLMTRWDFGPGMFTRVFRAAHVVCQPSRAEAFGLLPLEALACGVPIVATACTGHAEHVFGPGVVQVLHDENAPIDDGPGAMAPTDCSRKVARARRRSSRERGNDPRTVVVAAPAIGFCCQATQLVAVQEIA